MTWSAKIDLQEVSNAIQQALKEIHTRFDLKDSKSNIELEKDAIVLHSADEYKLKAVNDVLQQKLVKRGVSLKALTYGAVEPSAGGTAKRRVDHAARHRDRKGSRNRETGEGFEEEGAGLDPRGPGADQQ